MRRRYLCGALVGVLAVVGAMSTAWAASAASTSSQAQAKPSMMRPFTGKSSNQARPRRSSNLYYHGGVGGIGVETAPKVFLVLWGAGWSSDPSGESGILQNFLGGVGGSSWLNSVTQYCQGIASGSSTCSSAYAGNPSGILAGFWPDSSSAPTSPSQSQLAGEAVRAAAHFGNTSSSSNASVQYVIATAHNNNASGF